MSKTKTYRAYSVISLSVYVAGTPRRIAFEPKTDGRSTYTTADEEEQEALERSSFFNNMYVLDSETDDAETQKKNAKKKGGKAKADEKAGETQDAEKKAEKKTVEVADYGEAKDYLADKFGISRTQMYSESVIRAYAEKNNVNFVIKE